MMIRIFQNGGLFVILLLDSIIGQVVSMPKSEEDYSETERFVVNRGDPDKTIPQEDCGNISRDQWTDVPIEERRIPYQALLYITVNQGKAQCGGSVIHPNWILSAGHCVVNQPQGADPPPEDNKEALADSVEVHVGSDSREDMQNQVAGTQYRMSKCFLPHPKFEPGNNIYDASLIYMDKPLEFTDKVKPVCIPNKDFEYRGPGIVSGWGVHARPTAPLEALLFLSVPNKLKRFPVKVIDHKTCKEIMQDNILDLAVPHETHCCAWKRRRAANYNVLQEKGRVCFGDSGGPMVFYNETQQRVYQAGVVSSGVITCNNPKYPDLYTQPSYHSIFDWVKESIEGGKFKHCADEKSNNSSDAKRDENGHVEIRM